MKRTLIFALVLSYVANAHATTLLYKNLDDLAAESEGIVVGTVAKTESTYGLDKDIYTFVTIQSMQSIKGQLRGSELKLRFEGGQVGNDILDIEGSPHFETGERVVLFIRGNGRFKVPLVGWTQGVFRIAPDPVSGKSFVTDYEGNKLLGVSGKNLLKERQFESEAHVVNQGSAIQIQKSAQPEASPGAADDGQVSDSPSENNATAGQPLNLDQFLGDMKARVAAAAKAGSNNASTVESAGLPETTEHRQAVPAPGVQDQGQGTSQGEATAPALPRPTPVEPDQNNQ